jgi:hypothetical protein
MRQPDMAFILSQESNHQSSKCFLLHGCQISFGTTYLKGKYIPKGHKIYHMAIKYTIIGLSEAFQNVPNLGFLVCKYVYHLVRAWSLIYNKKTIVLFKRHCHAT